MTELFIPDFIKNIIEKCKDKNNNLSPKRLQTFKNNLEFQNWLKENNLTPRQVKYLLDNNLSCIPVCVCGNLVKFELGYNYCCIKCAENSNLVKDKIKNTSIKKYGKSSFLQSDICREKTINAFKEKYGENIINAFQSNEVKEKIKKTNIEKYCVKNPFASEEIKEKIKKTNLEKYGVENYSQTDEYKERVKITWNNKSKEEINKKTEKTKKTNLEKYGNEIPQSLDVVKEKKNKTCLEKYGENSYSSTDEFKKRINNSWKSKTIIEINDIVKKRKNASLEKYGTENPNQCQEIKEKKKKTCLEKYGVENYTQSDEYLIKHRKNFRNNYYDKFVILLSNKNISLLLSKDEYINSDILKFKCLICNNAFETDKTNPQNIYCPHCFKQRYSIKEKEVLDWIKTIYSGEIIENDRVILKGKELDIYIPEKKLAIEFNGNYWHNVEKVGKYYHQEKTLACKEQGIRLIHIFEYEWINKQDICKSLIKSALGTYNKSIYARNCIIKDISSDDYRNFLNENHLQGSVNSSIRYGLYYQNELLAVIGFGKSRFESGEIELHRFCCKLNYHIPGAFFKLIKNSNISNFITYVDLAHFSSEGYKKLGFKEISVTEPNYKWVKGDTALNRFSTRKHKLPLLLEIYDNNLTEEQNMLANDYYQIFDSGNLKLSFNF